MLALKEAPLSICSQPGKGKEGKAEFRGIATTLQGQIAVRVRLDVIHSFVAQQMLDLPFDHALPVICQ